MPKPCTFQCILRLEIQCPGVDPSSIASAICAAGGAIAADNVVRADSTRTVREVTIDLGDQEQRNEVIRAVRGLDGVRILEVTDPVTRAHLGGKIEVTPRHPVRNRTDLAIMYTPGVASICQAIHADPEKAYTLTIKRNTIAVVTDGTAVLGLGDIGPAAAMPVMEGKAMLFKQFAGVDAVPICLDTKDTEEFIACVKRMAPAFGGINLEDIAAPRCFEIERRLKEELDIPVFHDDQHGTAVVVLAGLINAARLVGKELSTLRVVVCGIGAAGTAISKLLMLAGVTDIVGVDRHGIIERGQEYPGNPNWQWYAAHSNPRGIRGGLDEAIEGADVFIGVSGPGVLKVAHLQRMARDPIVFALANPIPEIDPEEAAPYVRVMATGRSDDRNQVNNLLCFPGLFRGALDCRAREINDAMKLAAARALASMVTDEALREGTVVPTVFDGRVAEVVARAVEEAAYQTGVARRTPSEEHVAVGAD